jgi:hypothetical protein
MPWQGVQDFAGSFLPDDAGFVQPPIVEELEAERSTAVFVRTWQQMRARRPDQPAR